MLMKVTTSYKPEEFINIVWSNSLVFRHSDDCLEDVVVISTLIDKTETLEDRLHMHIGFAEFHVSDIF